VVAAAIEVTMTIDATTETTVAVARIYAGARRQSRWRQW
jgi:hypothetical protein